MALAVAPTLAALRARGHRLPRRPVRRAHADADGPRVLEFNVRFGDPETQVVLPRWQGDVAAVLAAAAAGRLDTVATPGASSPTPRSVWCWPRPGYPEPARSGTPIDGLAEASAQPACRSTPPGWRRRLVRRPTGRMAGRRTWSPPAAGSSASPAGPVHRPSPRAGLRRGATTSTGPGVRYRRDIAAAAERERNVTSEESGRADGLGQRPAQDGSRRRDAGDFGVEATEHVMSAHRTPRPVAALASVGPRGRLRRHHLRGGMAAHLAGAVAGPDHAAGDRRAPVRRRHRRHRRPVRHRADAPGIPVATVAIDGAANAALLAVEILAVTDDEPGRPPGRLPGRVGASSEPRGSRS